jgi:hypothetical protein
LNSKSLFCVSQKDFTRLMNTTDKDQNNHTHISIANDMSRGLWDAKILIIIGLLAVLFRGFYNNSLILDPSQLITTSNIFYKTPNDVIGKTVTIRSQDIQEVGSSSFTVKDKHFLDGKPIIVINASGKPFDLPTERNTPIQVTGQVQKLVPSEIERKFRLRLSEKYYKNYLNQPAIIAHSIAVSPDIVQITQNPSQFYGKKLALIGKVENIESPVLFTLNKNQFINTNDLLVLLTETPTAAITQDKTIALTGVVRPFVADNIVRDYKLKWNPQMKKQMEDMYGNKPILVAKVVYP